MRVGGRAFGDSAESTVNGPDNAQILGTADVQRTKSAKGIFIRDSTTTSSSDGVTGNGPLYPYKRSSLV